MSVKKTGPHDLGGSEAGAISRETHTLLWWEKRIDALYKLLSDDKRNILKVDELRYAIESLGEDAYARYGYYERWTLAMRELLVRKNVLTDQEIEDRIAHLKEMRQ